MSKKWTIPNAVKKFKPHQKKSLERNRGNLNTHEFNSLIKEMKCYYEKVMFDGKGRHRIIYTDKKRKVKVKKEDKRQFNKGQAPVHSIHLALMVMSKMEGIDNRARTNNGWATFFGLISPAEQDIMKGIYSVEALKPYKEFMIKLGIMGDGEENVFQDLADTLRKVRTGQLQTVLNQAAGDGMGLISIISSWKGKVKDSNEPIDINKAIAREINNMEDELLKKHGITKPYSLMFKNSPRTKAFKAEWLEYIENVEDAEGDAMKLQYIYEVFRIEVINKFAFDEYIKAHYPFEIDTFDLLENEQAYHSKLLDYVVENAQKKHDSLIKKFDVMAIKIDEGMQELLLALGMSEEEAAESIQQQMEEDAYTNEKEQSPYMALLESDGYVDCIRKLHVQLHSMSINECEEVKAESHMNGLLMSQELEHLLGETNPAEEEKEKSIQKGTRNCHESNMNTIEHQEELLKKEQIKQQQAIQAPEEIALENLEQQQRIDIPIIEPPEHYNLKDDYEYIAAMVDIEDEIRAYEDKYEDEAMEHIALDTVIRELTREVTAEEMISEFTSQWQCEKERERKEWEELFEGGNPVKWELTTNNPLEVFHRIKYSRI